MGVARLTINDPERRNPVSSALFNRLIDALAGLPADTRVVVLTGAGEEAFASGADMEEMARLGAEGLGGGFGDAMQNALRAIELHPAPVIARIQGHCLGAGYQLALACDLRIAVDSARLGVPASRFGLLPGQVHHARMLLQLGTQVTRELMLTGRSFTGAAAVERGLADYAVPRVELDSTVDGVVDDILGGAPITVRNAKRMINTLLTLWAAGQEIDGETRATLDGLSTEAHTSEDVAEGLRAFFERRKPEFKGR